MVTSVAADNNLEVVYRRSLHSIKTRQTSAPSLKLSCQNNDINVAAGGRRRSLCGKTSLSNASLEVGYHAEEPAAVPFVWESAPGTPKHHSFDKLQRRPLPPLTPPPSYQYYSQSNNNRVKCNTLTDVLGSGKKHNNSDMISKQPANINLIQSIFPRWSLKRDTHTPLAVGPPSSPSSSSSSDSSASSSSSRKSTSSSSGSQTALLASPHRRSSGSSRSALSKHLSKSQTRLSFYESRSEPAGDDQEDENVSSGCGSGSPVSTLCFSLMRTSRSSTASRLRGCQID